MTDHAVAARIAREAGELLLSLRARQDLAGDALRAAGDQQSHSCIMALLGEAYPDDAVLSEEGRDDTERLQRSRVWIVDPLDGTREFAEDGRSDWAVHVALVVDGIPAAAAVALPALNLVLGTQPPASVAPPHNGPPRLVVSRTRPPSVTQTLQSALGAELVSMGSAGAKAMAVLRGEADVYAHAGGQYEWDSAAPVGVAAAAGLHVSRLDGSSLRYNQADVWLPDLLICRPELAGDVLAAVKGQ